MSDTLSGRYLFDNIIDFGKISNSFTQNLSHAGGFMTILPPGIYTPADGQYIDMVFDTIVFDYQGDFIYYGNQDRMLEVYDARGGGWKDQSFRDIEFLPNTVVSDLLFTMLTECANNDDLPQPPRWQPKAKKIDLNKFLAEKIADPYRNNEFIAGQSYNVQVIAHSNNEYFDTSAPADTFEFKAAEPYNTDGGLYDENGVNIVSWDTLTEFYEMAIHELNEEVPPGECKPNTGNPMHSVLEEYSYKYYEERSREYEPNAYWLGNIALTKFPEACTLVIPEGVTYVRENLLANICSRIPYSDLNITTLYLPSTVEKIGKNAFIGAKLTKIYYNGDSKSWSQIHFVNRYSNPCAAAHTYLMYKKGNVEAAIRDRRLDPQNLFKNRHNRDKVSDVLDLDDYEFNHFMVLPDFYIKPTSKSDYQSLVEIDIQGTREDEFIHISDYAFVACGKHVETITLDSAVKIIGKDAFDVFVARSTSWDTLPIRFYYNGTIEQWMTTGLTSHWSNPGHSAMYIAIRDSGIQGIDDEENPCSIETLEVPLSSQIRGIKSYIFAGWHANVFKFNIEPTSDHYTIDSYAFDRTYFKEIIINTTLEVWDRVRFMNHKSASPLYCNSYVNVFIYDADLDDYVKLDATVYIPQRNTSVKAYKYARLHSVEKVYIPPSVKLISRDAFVDCDNLKLIDCTACSSDGLPHIRRPLSHPLEAAGVLGHPNFISSPFMVSKSTSQRPTILIPRDRNGRDWEYLGGWIRKDISGEMNHWESCNIEHATSNLSTSTAINIKIYDVSATLSVRLKNIPGMTVDWGDGSFTYKPITSQLTDSEYITHTYQDFSVQVHYNCDARTIRIYDVDHIPSDFFELNTNMPQNVGIATLTIANGIKSIGKNAFGNVLNWDRLENIYISNTVSFIDQDAFGDYMRQDAFVVFEDAQNYSWYSTPQANTFTDSDECLSIDSLSCFDNYETSDGTSQNSGMLSAVEADGKVLYRYSAPKSYIIKIKTAVNGYMIDNGSSTIYNYPGEAQISIGKGAKNITAACTLGADECSVKPDYNQTTGILTLTISGTASATNYMIKYSYSLPD